MSIRQGLLLVILLSLLTSIIHASVSITHFDTSEQERLYQQLVGEFRCLVCQNQNIADSDAGLAQDLRQKTYELVKQNRDAKYIKHYMQQRFGEFILYSPPLTFRTLSLWIIPLSALCLALFFFALKLRRRS